MQNLLFGGGGKKCDELTFFQTKLKNELIIIIILVIVMDIGFWVRERKLSKCVYL